MVLNYYGETKIKAYDIVKSLFLSHNCEEITLSSLNKPCKWKDIKILFSFWQVKSTFLLRKIPFSKLMSEINSGRPVLIGYKIKYNIGHVVLVIGYKITANGIKNVRVIDPINGLQWINYKEELIESSQRRWYCTWINIQKNMVNIKYKRNTKNK
jgi:hypothetical protein